MPFDCEMGIDIIETSRFKNKLYEKNQNFYHSIFSTSEIKHCQKFNNSHVHFAGLFAAKEAIIKSLPKPLKMISIEIVWNEYGKPYVKINKNISNDLKISISHTQYYAVSVALNKL